MERRDWSVKALNQLIYIDSLDSAQRADSLVRWYNKYLKDNDVSTFDLELEDLKKLLELFYKNIDFLKSFKEETRQNMVSNKKMQKFLSH